MSASGGELVNGERLVRRRSFLSGGASGAIALLTGCGGSGGPSPTPSPTPTGTPTNLPNGVPNATMLQNLPLAASLAQRYRPGCVFSRCHATGVTPGGTLREGSAWGFSFTARLGERVVLDLWEVYSDGHVVYFPDRDRSQPILFEPVDIASSVQVDSSQGLSLAMGYGLAACYATRSEDSLRITYIVEQPGATTPSIRILATTSREGGIAEIFMSPRTGELFAKNLFC